MICCGMNANGVACTSTTLIEAHIIPRGFARDVMAGHSHNVKISTSNVGITQHGVYDLRILCAVCDGNLGQYDDYALEVFRRFPNERVVSGDGTYTMSDVKTGCAARARQIDAGA